MPVLLLTVSDREILRLAEFNLPPVRLVHPFALGMIMMSFGLLVSQMVSNISWSLGFANGAD